jgi:hypothetical protein
MVKGKSRRFVQQLENHENKIFVVAVVAHFHGTIPLGPVCHVIFGQNGSVLD